MSGVEPMLGGNDLLRRVGISSYRVDGLDATLFYDFQSRQYRLPPDELPPAAAPNDLRANPLVSDPGLSVASQMRALQFLALPLGTSYAEGLPTTSYALQVRPGVYYDTGAFESSPTRFLPGNIALDKTDAARTRGNIVFNDLGNNLQSTPIRGQLNNTFDGVQGTAPTILIAFSLRQCTDQLGLLTLPSLSRALTAGGSHSWDARVMLNVRGRCISALWVARALAHISLVKSMPQL